MLQFVRWYYSDANNGDSSDAFPVWAIFFTGNLVAIAFNTCTNDCPDVHSLHGDRDRACNPSLLMATQPCGKGDHDRACNPSILTAKKSQAEIAKFKDESKEADIENAQKTIAPGIPTTKAEKPPGPRDPEVFCESFDEIQPPSTGASVINRQ